MNKNKKEKSVVLIDNRRAINQPKDLFWDYWGWWFALCVFFIFGIVACVSYSSAKYDKAIKQDGKTWAIENNATIENCDHQYHYKLPYARGDVDTSRYSLQLWYQGCIEGVTINE